MIDEILVPKVNKIPLLCSADRMYPNACENIRRIRIEFAIDYERDRWSRFERALIPIERDRKQGFYLSVRNVSESNLPIFQPEKRRIFSTIVSVHRIVAS